MSRPTGNGPPEGGFLARWSRRKLTPRDQLPDEPETVATAVPEAAAPEPADAAAPDPVDEAALSDSELLVRYELPDPESLTVVDDVAAFMRAGVPSRLRNLALRRMWKLHPVLANLDGLVEYNDDYTDAATVIPNLKTTYQVGRGAAAYLQDALEKARLAGEADETVEAVEATPEPDAIADDRTGGDAEPAEAPGVESVEAEPPAEDRPPAEPVIRRRHMVFSAHGPEDDA